MTSRVTADQSFDRAAHLRRRGHAAGHPPHARRRPAAARSTQDRRCARLSIDAIPHSRRATARERQRQRPSLQPRGTVQATGWSKGPKCIPAIWGYERGISHRFALTTDLLFIFPPSLIFPHDVSLAALVLLYTLICPHPPRLGLARPLTDGEVLRARYFQPARPPKTVTRLLARTFHRPLQRR